MGGAGSILGLSPQSIRAILDKNEIEVVDLQVRLEASKRQSGQGLGLGLGLGLRWGLGVGLV